MAQKNSPSGPALGMALLLTLTLIWACATAPPQQGPCTVAVWELENIGVSGAMADAGGLMTARVLETFQAAGRCATIEREKLTLALEELNLSASQLTDEDTRLRIGRRDFLLTLRKHTIIVTNYESKRIKKRHGHFHRRR